MVTRKEVNEMHINDKVILDRIIGNLEDAKYRDGEGHEVLFLSDVINIVRDNICDTIAFDFTTVKEFDCPCGRHYVNIGMKNDG